MQTKEIGIILLIALLAVGLITQGIPYFEIEQPHMFGIADTPQTLNTIGVFQAIDFNFNLGDAHEFHPQDLNCLVVEKAGHYYATYEAHFQDLSPAPNANIGMRISQNGLEISGSYSEEDTTKQNADITFTTFAYIEADTNDIICMEWTASDIDVKLMSDNAFAQQDIVAKGFIQWIYAD